MLLTFFLHVYNDRMFKKTYFVFIAVFIFTLTAVSCSSKKSGSEQQPPAKLSVKNHIWYYFTADGFEKTDLPQNAPKTAECPWTEARRISSAASSVSENSGAHSYAVVNKLGILSFESDGPHLYKDVSFFSEYSAGSLVFSAGKPVFNLYRSTFFNEVAASSSNASRPFLVEFNPESGMFFPLVTYENLGLLPADQITGFFWNGTTWSCSVKKTEAGKVSFSYFFWEPPVALTELSPALSYETFIFSPCTEAQYRKINLPLLFDAAPAGLAELLSPIPEEFSFYVSWRDNSGTSPVNYFQQGSGGITLNAKAARIPVEQYTAAVFSDGTVYIKKDSAAQQAAFRLPKPPAGFCYGEFAVADGMLYVAWEETSFFKTGRAGFISVGLSEVMDLINSAGIASSN